MIEERSFNRVATLSLPHCLGADSLAIVAEVLMTHRLKPLAMPILVTAIDVAWAWWLATHAKPWLITASGLSELEAIQHFETILEPRLWIGYSIVLAAQQIWVNLILRRSLPQQRLRQLWWLGFGISSVGYVVLRQGLVLTSAASQLLLIVPIGDLILLYWLATRLLTPLPQRRVIPGWW
jgi:hypothetical protein